MIEALLLDLGNVVVEVDFRRTFRRWAASAAAGTSDPVALESRWVEDEAYQAHERGEISFDDYVVSVGARLGISLARDEWLAGWNDLFVGPYPRVQTRLAELAGRLPLYAFTNSNPTHERVWRARYGNALSHFRQIFVSSTLGLRKPEREAFERVAQAMRIPPNAVLFLDDNLENIDGAAAAGLQTAWVRGEEDVLRALADF